MLLNIFSDISSIVDLYFEHLWYENEKNGHIASVIHFTKSKIPEFIITYRKTEEVGCSKIILLVILI